MRFDLVFENWQIFAQGVLLSLQLTAFSLAIGLAIALPGGIARAWRVPVWSPLINGYIYLFRGTPFLVQLYLIYYGLGLSLGQYDFVRESLFWPILREAYWLALIALALNSGAYSAEIIRGVVETTPRGELEAAKALGMSPWQVMRRVLIPSALRRALPQYGNEVVFTLHASALVSVITLQDILGAGRTLNARYYLAYEGFLTAAALYMIITFCIVMAFRMLERKYLAHLRVAEKNGGKSTALFR